MAEKTTRRQAGLLGCLPGQIPVGLREFTYYVAGDLPKPPASVAVPSVHDWGMLGNDRYGDCGIAGLQHGFEADAVITDGFHTRSSRMGAMSSIMSLNYVATGVQPPRDERRCNHRCISTDHRRGHS